MIALNDKNKYFIALKKNRRVMGLNSKSISFRTHAKNNEMHEFIIGEYLFENRIYQIKTQKMAFLTRMFILGLADEFMAEGRKMTKKYDDEILFTGNSHISHQEIVDYYLSLPTIISFRLLEYEKQVLYLYCLSKDYKPVEIMRYLYNSNFESFDLNNIDIELFFSLFTGISEKILCEILHFTQVNTG